MQIKQIIERALTQSISYQEYQDILNQFAEEGKTSGAQKEDLVYYTKLNTQRSRRIEKTT